MEKIYCDYLIVGAGMVGLSIAHQLKILEPNKKIFVIEKESEVGFHSSGRNSGVLHAGIYYKPETLKAKLCINGARRLKKWCKDQKIQILYQTNLQFFLIYSRNELIYLFQMLEYHNLLIYLYH